MDYMTVGRMLGFDYNQCFPENQAKLGAIIGINTPDMTHLFTDVLLWTNWSKSPILKFNVTGGFREVEREVVDQYIPMDSQEDEKLSIHFTTPEGKRIPKT